MDLQPRLKSYFSVSFVVLNAMSNKISTVLVIKKLLPSCHFVWITFLHKITPK